MTTTKRNEAEKLARSKVRIKEYTDCFGDRVYKVQTKKWYGWVTKPNGYSILSTTIFNSYRGARIAAEAEIERLINKKEVAKYYYYPF